MKKLKIEQVELFTEFLVKIEIVKTGKCTICGRAIKNGKIGSGCKAKIKKEILRLSKILE